MKVPDHPNPSERASRVSTINFAKMMHDVETSWLRGPQLGFHSSYGGFLKWRYPVWSSIFCWDVPWFSYQPAMGDPHDYGNSRPSCHAVLHGKLNGSLGHLSLRREFPKRWAWFPCSHMAVCQNLVPLVNIKIAGKWMFIPLKMYL